MRCLQDPAGEPYKHALVVDAPKQLRRPTSALIASQRETTRIAIIETTSQLHPTSSTGHGAALSKRDTRVTEHATLKWM